MSNKIDIHDLFLTLQSQLDARLNGIRRVIPHGTTLGDATEDNWRGMLEDYLPLRYRVSKGHVIDADGEMSGQIDVIVHDRQYSPFLFNQNDVLYVPAESVYAVFEIKQDFSREYIKAAGAKAASVRKLRRTSQTIHHLTGPTAPKQLHRIVAGILCSSSSWTPAMGTPLEKSLNELSEKEHLDIGCAVKGGAFEVSYPEDADPIIEKSTEETALIFFFLRFMERLQRLGTVPAIDLREYGRALSKI